MKQTIDIVDRLMIVWTSMTDMGNAERREAADGIYRLREQLRLANIDNFNANAEIERLRDELVRNADEFRETLTELRQRVKTITAERDEARRSCCEYAAIVDGADTADGMESGRFYEIAMKYMKDRGWDCFKEANK
jgi:hypothetical protein